MTAAGLALFDRIAPVHLHGEEILLSAAVARRRRAAVGLSDRTDLLVAEVGADAPAGVATGDLLVAANGKQIRHVDDLPEMKPHTLRLVRGEQDLTVSPA